MPQQKRLDAPAEIPKRLRKIAGFAMGAGEAVGSRQAHVGSVRMAGVDDHRMLLVMGIAGGAEDGGPSERSALKRLRPSQDA